VVAGRSQKRGGRPHAVSGRLMLIHTCYAHAALCRGLERSLSDRHGRGMTCVNQTRPHCVNKMGKTQYKPLAARHGRGTALARHGMCKVAFKILARMSPAALDPFFFRASGSNLNLVGVWWVAVMSFIDNRRFHLDSMGVSLVRRYTLRRKHTKRNPKYSGLVPPSIQQLR
jgi:hypothetical protein